MVDAGFFWLKMNLVYKDAVWQSDGIIPIFVFGDKRSVLSGAVFDYKYGVNIYIETEEYHEI